MALLTVILLVGLFEALFRVAQFDFRRLESQWRKTPPFVRGPTVPIGTVYYRREGPEQWSGQVIRRSMESFGVASDSYADEPSIDVRYDALGFRNEIRPEVWEIAVAGDTISRI